MKNNWQTKKTYKIVVEIIFLIFAIAYFLKFQYIFSFLSLGLFFLSLRLNEIIEFAVSVNDGFKAKYHIPDEKIKQDIKDNKEHVNERNFINFKQIEEMVLRSLQKKIKGEMKRQIHFAYGGPSNLQFAYTPDAVIQTDKELIFIEIKYVSKFEFTDKIIRGGIEQLKMVLDKFGPSVGKKLVAKLVLVSNFTIDYSEYKIPKGMELEVYKL